LAPVGCLDAAVGIHSRAAVDRLVLSAQQQRATDDRDPDDDSGRKQSPRWPEGGFERDPNEFLRVEGVGPLDDDRVVRKGDVRTRDRVAAGGRDPELLVLAKRGEPRALVGCLECVVEHELLAVLSEELGPAERQSEGADVPAETAGAVDRLDRHRAIGLGTGLGGEVLIQRDIQPAAGAARLELRGDIAEGFAFGLACEFVLDGHDPVGTPIRLEVDRERRRRARCCIG
jgi:hypothetical protein